MGCVPRTKTGICRTNTSKVVVAAASGTNSRLASEALSRGVRLLSTSSVRGWKLHFQTKRFNNILMYPALGMLWQGLAFFHAPSLPPLCRPFYPSRGW